MLKIKLNLLNAMMSSIDLKYVSTFATKISTNDIPENYNYIIPMLSEKKKNLVRKCIYKEDQLRYLKSEWLIRTIIEKYFNLEKSSIQFIYNEFGKPYLKGVKNFYFNLSHSGLWVVCAISSQEVGIDIEEITPINFEHATKYFSSCELKTLMLKNESKKLSYFYDLWTLKESFIKAIGKGHSIPLDSFRVICNNTEISVASDYNISVYFHQYDIDPDYKLSVCAKSKNFAKSVTFIN